MQIDRHERPGIAGDFVHARANILHISVEELFQRAYADANLQRSSGRIPYVEYAHIGKSGKIPDPVRVFCEQPLPTCANPTCPEPTTLARFTKTNVRGKTFYFCGLDCMNATPDAPDNLPDPIEESAEGLRILERVRAAFSKAIYIETSPITIRPLKGQPREVFDEDGMVNLVRSLNEVGQIYPGIIRRIER